MVLDPIGAIEGFRRVGEFTIRLEDLETVVGKELLPKRGIFRDPTPDDNQVRMFGMVNMDYTLLTPQDFCQIWDNSVPQSLETLGILGHGEEMFLTIKLPSVSIKGDDVDNYLLAVNDMSGKEKMLVKVTSVRVVCQNTLMVAKGQSTLAYKIAHNAEIKETLHDNLVNVFSSAVRKSEEISVIFKALANKRVTPEEIETVLNFSYPLPFLKENPTQEDRNFYERIAEAMEARKLAALDLFRGRGKGSETEAAVGTAWGLYNAITELENFREGHNDKTVSRGVLFGSRGYAMSSAYKAVVNLLWQ